MKKGIVILTLVMLISIVCITGCVLPQKCKHEGGMATCDKKAICLICDEEYGELIEHNYAELKHNKTEHWMECICGAKEGVVEHEGGTATCTTLAKCSFCKIEYGDFKEHGYSMMYLYNETHHWRDTTCGCNSRADYEIHNKDDSGFCTVCDKAISPTKGILYSYEEDGAYAVVVGYEGASTKINIASEYNGVPVKAINNSAFKNSAIMKVIIPNSVNRIGDYAFYGCSSLETISLPSSITNIGDYAFSFCNSLTRIVINYGVESIGSYAFYQCDSLTIYCKDSSQSSGWSQSWNISNCPVVWDYRWAGSH